MKKKLLLSLVFCVIVSSVAFARNDELSLELSKLKNAKNAKETVINTQIQVTTNDITNILIDNKLSESEKNKQVAACQKKLEDLNNKKVELKYQYKKDKKELKKQYKK